MGSISYTHCPLSPTGQGAPGRLPRPSLPIRLSICRQESDTPTPSLERPQGPGPLHGERPGFSNNLINMEETENTTWEELGEVADAVHSVLDFFVPTSSFLTPTFSSLPPRLLHGGGFAPRAWWSLHQVLPWPSILSGLPSAEQIPQLFRQESSHFTPFNQ